MSLYFENLEINSLLGMDRNKATGDDPDQAFAPYEVYNLSPNRRGALSPFGESRVGDELPNLDDGSNRFIGFDMDGLVTFSSGQPYENKFKIYNLARRTENESTKTYNSTLDTSVHIPRFGAYKSQEEFCGYYSSGALMAEPFSLAPTSGVSETSPSDTLDINVGGEDITGIAYGEVEGGESYWVVCTKQGKVWAGTELNGLSLFVSRSGTIFRNVRYGNGIFVVVGDNSLIKWGGPSGYRSFTLDYALYDVVYHENTDRFVVVGKRIYTSSSVLDDGWTLRHKGNHGTITNVTYWAVGVNPDNGFLVALTSRSTFFGASVHNVSNDGGLNWNPSAHFGGQAIAFVNGTFVAVKGSEVRTGVYSNSTRNSGSVVTKGLGSGGFKRGASDGSVAYFVGENSQIFRTTTGDRFSRIDSSVDTTWNDVNFVDGVVYIVGDDGNAIAIATSGESVDPTIGDVPGNLRPGRYKLYWVVSVETEVGRLTVDSGSRDYTLAADINSISVTLPSVDQILANNSSNRSLSRHLLENFTRVDVYLSSQVGVTADEESEENIDPLADTAPVFAFTLRPGGNGNVINDIPIGRTLNEGEGALSVAFSGDGNVVIHGDRVWGLLSRDSTRYHPIDEASKPNVSDFSGAYPIGYTEIGYLNFSRPGNYVPLTPSGGGEFVGLAPSPSGILVFFTTETHLISGEPDLGTLQVELYPAMVGADVGTKPVSIGGVTFTIWKGQVYVLSGGQAQWISRPVDDRTDPFREIIADPKSSSLLVRSESGRVFRYMIEYDFWLVNTVPEATHLLYSPLHGIVQTVSGERRFRYSDTVDDGGPISSVPYLTYRAFDYGAKQRIDTTYRVEVPTFDYPEPDTPPRLFFKILENDADVEAAGARSVDGRYEEGVYRFTLPRGMRSRMGDFKFEFRGMRMNSTIEPQLLFHYIPHSLRNRYAPKGNG